MRKRLAHAPELLDDDVHDPAELEQSLDQVAEVNAMLGGRRAAWRAVLPLLRAEGTTSILDIGTGSADIPMDLASRATRARRLVRITATDVHAQIREIASRRTADVPAITVADADALALPFDNDSHDIVLLSMTLHHFEEAEQVTALREAGRVARCAVIVNELERCRANWVGARFLAATRWRGNRITRHDGPLSVLRAFTGAELAATARTAGLTVESVRRRWFFRLVMVARP
ncbi:MAG TPA: methyltransferase domain-containing protein [Longimicrobiales bacterium]|nr:methyltransferase domain-containing protein [Longimicrobiales bacterium]